MRILGIETSTRRGSVALVADGRVIAAATHEQPNAHAEEILPMIERLMASASLPRSALDRIAVGVGPGSFTGLRVGIALAQGLGLGLGIPVVGVGSLQAMAAAGPATDARVRCPLLDARREEVFAALYTAEGVELVAPRALPRAGFARALAALGEADPLIMGEVSPELADLPQPFHSPETDLPHAAWTALVGASLPVPPSVEPVYVRDACAVLPNLPPSPFGNSR